MEAEWPWSTPIQMGTGFGSYTKVMLMALSVGNGGDYWGELQQGIFEDRPSAGLRGGPSDAEGGVRKG